MAGAVTSWAIVVPVKRLPIAKTRLLPAGPLREELALALAADTVAAAAACSAVAGIVVVTDDEQARAALAAAGAAVVADAPDAGLNPALRHGAVEAARLLPGCGVAALSADLAALRPADLAEVLHAAAAHPAAVVADAAGDGTALLAAAALPSFRPEFGPGSWQAHVSAGAVDLSGMAAASVRRDVDTVADLAAACRLGCGPATRRVVAGHGELAVAAGF